MRRSWVRHGHDKGSLAGHGRRRYHVFLGQRRTDTQYGYRMQGKRELLVFWLSHPVRVLEDIPCIFRTYPASYRLCLLPGGKQRSPHSYDVFGWVPPDSNDIVITHFGLSPKVGLGSCCWCHPCGQSSSRGRIAAVKTPPAVATLCDPSNVCPGVFPNPSPSACLNAADKFHDMTGLVLGPNQRGLEYGRPPHHRQGPPS